MTDTTTPETTVKERVELIMGMSPGELRNLACYLCGAAPAAFDTYAKIIEANRAKAAE